MSEKESKGVAYIKQKYGVEPKDFSEHSDLLFSIYDKVQNMFLPPFPCATVEAAKRSVLDVASSQPNSLMAKYPMDYELYYLCRWNNKTGDLSIDFKEKICDLYSLLCTRKDSKGEVQQSL